MRSANIKRETTETMVDLSIFLDGKGQSKISTGIGFFDHMLDLFSSHGLFDLTLNVKGDLHVDAHHTVEDVGICLGTAFKQALGDCSGIRRYSSGMFPMDDSLCALALDISGRPFLSIEPLPSQSFGSFHSELVAEFFRAFVTNAGCNLFVSWPHKGNLHHVIEALFKGVGRVLDDASQIDKRRTGIPSTKGVL